MFCIKCGKQINDWAAFCEFCGAPTAAPVQTEQAAPTAAPTPPPATYTAPTAAPTPPPPPTAYTAPIPQQAPVYAAAAAPRKSHKGVVITIIVVVVLLAVAAGLYFFVLRDKKPTMKINGETIPLLFSGYSYCTVDTGTDGYAALFVGEKDNELYSIAALFLTEDYPEYPSANTTYSLNSFGDAMAVQFDFEDPLNDASCVMISYYEDEFYTAEVKTGKFTPREGFDISVSGKCEEDGLTFEFSASGVLEFYSDEWEDKLESLYDEFMRSANNTP